MDDVRVWKEEVIIPTYEVGLPEKYPVFLDKRVYQASSGVVYPNSVIEHISDKKVDKLWDAIYIENRYIKIMVLPALGGRIQMAYDKIRERHFVYYNKVIKPALVGLTGPWISGGIEFNWPQHHRPSTYDPVDFSIEENKDGSKTIWVSEVERMFRTKGMAGFTLHPDKAYLEIKAKLYNRTSQPQTFLWWANPAVAVNEHYQSVFPPDVNAVFDHGKRDVSEFPIAKGEYYKVNYAPGTDISKYKNIPVPTSYMAISSEYDFVGGYENDTKGGLLHVANHHISPGKKQWTWGNGDFGKAWDRNLSDTDEPYLELMCGVYTDNQPDFAWMHPYEEKSFKQFFIPYYNVGIVKNANTDALINLEVHNDEVNIKIHVTGVFRNSKIQLLNNTVVVFEENRNLSPQNGYENTVAHTHQSDNCLKVILLDHHGTVIIEWTLRKVVENKIPEAAKAAKLPNEINDIDELYFQGLHLEQYRHATYEPTSYYLEALSRSPSDARCNNAMGLWYLKKGQFELSLLYFEKAIETITRYNPNPYDGEPFFNYGLALTFLNRTEEAYAALYKSVWNSAWQDPGYFHLAQIDSCHGNYVRALELVQKSLFKNWHNHKSRHLKIALLRKLGRKDDALRFIEESLDLDKFNFGALYERYLISGLLKDFSELKIILRDNAHNYIEFSIDYAQYGLFEEAISLLEFYIDGKEYFYPMVAYFLGWFHEQLGSMATATSYYVMGGTMPMDYCFPSRLEEVIVLKAAMRKIPDDGRAPYYLGNFWYASKQFEKAKECWELSAQLDGSNSICQRNLALLYFNKTNQKDLTEKHLKLAISLDLDNARLFMEYDQFLKIQNAPINERMENLKMNSRHVQFRDDLFLEQITLYNLIGRYEKALTLLNSRQFHPWEGGEGQVLEQYTIANVALAKKEIQNENYTLALHYLANAQTYPHNLGEGKLLGTQENDIFFWIGCVYELLGKKAAAIENWEKGAVGTNDLNQPMFYNDRQPDKIFYQGLSLLKLKKTTKANNQFEKLRSYGIKHASDSIKIEYFAISLPNLLVWEEDLDERNRIYCNYLKGLGNLGLGNTSIATTIFENIMEQNRYHFPSHIHLELAKSGHPSLTSSIKAD